MALLLLLPPCTSHCSLGRLAWFCPRGRTAIPSVPSLHTSGQPHTGDWQALDSNPRFLGKRVWGHPVLGDTLVIVGPLPRERTAVSTALLLCGLPVDAIPIWLTCSHPMRWPLGLAPGRSQAWRLH